MKHRIVEISMVKGIGILMVICVHLLSISGLKAFCGVGTKIELSLIAPLMILFFLVAGYLNSDRKACAPRAYFSKRLKHIFACYYAAAAVILAVYAFIYLGIEGKSFGWYMDGAIGILLQFQAFHWLDPSATGLHPMYYGLVVGWFLFQMTVADLIFVPILHCINGKKNIWKLVLAAAFLALAAVLYRADLQDLNDAPFSRRLLIAFVLPNIPGEVGLLMLGDYLESISYLDFDSYPAPRLAAAAAISFGMLLAFIATDDYSYRFPFGTWGAFGPWSFFTGTLFGLALLTLLGVLCHILKKVPALKKTLGYLGDISISILITHYFVAFLTAYAGGFWYEPMSGPAPEKSAAEALGQFFLLLGVVLFVCCFLPIAVKRLRERRRPT